MSKTISHLKKIGQQLFLLLSLAVLLVDVAHAQTTPDDDTPIKVDTLLLTIPFNVADKTGRNVPGLKKENFSVYQNGDKQDIEFLFNDEAPMNVAILLDTSVSTKPVLDKIQKAARDFLKVFRPEDRGIIVSFDSRIAFLSELTSDRKKLSKAIDHAEIAGTAGSYMNEAVLRVIKEHFESFKGRKAIIVLTDGMVMGRSITTQETLNTLQQADTLFYPIIFKTKYYTDERLISASRKRPLPVELLQFLAEETAGRFYEKDASNLKEAFQNIAEELKNQYLLGFYSQNPERGKSVGHIKIAVDPKDLTVQSKKRNF
jgi:VWFA-related protein